MNLINKLFNLNTMKDQKKADEKKSTSHLSQGKNDKKNLENKSLKEETKTVKEAEESGIPESKPYEPEVVELNGRTYKKVYNLDGSTHLEPLTK